MPTFGLTESYNMTCIKPITAWKKKSSSLKDDPIKYYNDKKILFKKPKARLSEYEEIKIPCGRCTGCLLDKSNTWATRIALETQNHAENCFITLTYKNEKVPRTPTGHLTLSKRDVQLFFKKLREHLKVKVSYFCCGEYGTNTHRPHMHICLFGWKPKDLKQMGISKTENAMYTSKELEKIWGNGYVAVQELNYKTACYTARYCMKKAGIKPQKRISTGEVIPEVKIDERTGKPFIRGKSKYINENKDLYGREKEFIMMSKKPAIGLAYWQKNKEKIIRDQGILLKVEKDVKHKPIPRYFKKKWNEEDWENLDRYQYTLKKQGIENHEKQLETINAKDKEKTWLETIKYNLLYRAKLLKREQN